MVALYVVSAEGAAGKTMICAGMGKHLIENGKKVGFLKPIIAEKKSAEGSDGDAAFIKQVLALAEPADSLCPLIGDEKVLADRVRKAYIDVSQGKDVVIVEGRCGKSPDDKLSEASYEVAEALKAKVIIVEGYSSQPPGAKLNRYKAFGDNLLGVVFNKVPKGQLKRVSDEIVPQFDEAGISVLGILPEDRALFAMTVGELTDRVQGEILNDSDKSAELVENIMLGAMLVDSALEYFGRKANKAVVIRDDRPDMQLAALETSTRCLVISGNTAPSYSIRYRAEGKGVPIIVTSSDTSAVIASIEEALGNARFNQEKKLPKLAEIMQQSLNFQALYSGLGLAS